MHRRILTIALIALAIGGCRSNPETDTYVSVLNAEYRLLEDRLYDLEYELEIQDEELARLEKENEELRSESSGGRPNRGARTDNDFNREDGGLERIQPPVVDPGDGAPPSVLEQLQGDLPLDGPSATLTSHDRNHDRNRTNRVADPEDMRVTHIVLNQFLTGGHDFDSAPGDDGLSVVIEPRNADDLFVPVPGDVDVVALDTAKQGPDARVGRWTLDAKEIGLRMRDSEKTGRGIHLKLPWPDLAPDNGNLLVFVRYTTDDGRKLETNAGIHVALPGEFSTSWSPRPPTSAHVPTGVTRKQAGGNLSPVGILKAPPAGLSSPGQETATAPSWRPFR